MRVPTTNTEQPDCPSLLSSIVAHRRHVRALWRDVYRWVRSVRFSFALALAISILAMPTLGSADASAQAGPKLSPDTRLEYVPPQKTMEELQREYDSIRLWGPALGIPVSYLTIGLGFSLVVAGNFCIYPPCEQTTGGRTMTAFGAIIMAAGVAGIVASAIRISQKRKKKRRIEWEMGRLRFGSS